MNLFPDSDSATGKGAELCNPKHWFIVVGTGPYQVRNLTIGQTLLGEYETKQQANNMIKKIHSTNPTFQLRSARP